MNLEEKLAYYKELSVEERLAKLEEKVERLRIEVEALWTTDARVDAVFRILKKHGLYVE